LVEVVLARGVSQPEVARYVFLFVGLFFVALIFRFPLATAIVFFGLTDFIFPTSFFSHNVGSLTVKPHEVALACLFLLAVVAPKRRTWGGTPGVALAVFLGLVALSAVVGVEAGRVSLTEAFNWARPLGLFTMFYVIIRLFPDAEERRVMLIAVAIMAALAGVAAVLISFGAGFGSDLEGTNTNTITEGLGSIQRVRLVGLSAGYAIFWYVVVLVSVKRGWSRVGAVLVLAGILADIAVSFNRNMWLGLVFGAILMAVLGGAAVRHRLAVGATIAIAGVAVLVIFGTSATQEQLVQPLVKRGATILNPGKTSRESSLEERSEETSLAFEVARRHPLLGVGAGASFDVFKAKPISTGSFIIGTTNEPQLFLHNQYLYLVLISGIPGLIAFVLFLGSSLLDAMKRVPRDPAIVALGVGIAMIMISSVVAIYFTVDDMVGALALLTGVVVADAEGLAAKGESSGLSS
jgi:O-antigen ligase